MPSIELLMSGGGTKSVLWAFLKPQAGEEGFGDKLLFSERRIVSIPKVLGPAGDWRSGQDVAGWALGVKPQPRASGDQGRSAAVSLPFTRITWRRSSPQCGHSQPEITRIFDWQRLSQRNVSSGVVRRCLQTDSGFGSGMRHRG